MANARERYEALARRRSAALSRARDCAALTIPALMPPEGHSVATELPTPAQGFGARGVNNLASKMLLALMPLNQPFFKFEVDNGIKRVIEAEDDQAMTHMNEELSHIEQALQTAIESSSDRTVVFEAIRHLIALSDALLYMPNKAGMKLYRLDQYVVRRDKMGRPLEIVIKETVARETLPARTRNACKLDETPADPNAGRDETVDVYTWVRRQTDDGHARQVVHQEINGTRVPNSDGHYPADKPAFIPLRWTAVAGEDYGRSLVYEYIGDIRTLEGLSQSVNEFAANAAKILWLTNPNGVTDATECNEAESGAFVPGVEGDIHCLSMDKFPDFRIVESRIAALENRLEAAFLLTSSVQRDAERVTAEEIRLMARELEDALGGVYSVLSQEFQLPYIRRKIVQQQRLKEIPDFPDNTVEPRITTGLAALGRGHDLEKLRGFLGDLGTLPESVAAQLVQQMDPRDLASRLATARGINIAGLFRDPQVVAAEQQQAQMQQMVAESAPGVAQEAVRQAGNAMNAPQ